MRWGMGGWGGWGENRGRAARHLHMALDPEPKTPNCAGMRRMAARQALRMGQCLFASSEGLPDLVDSSKQRAYSHSAQPEDDPG